MANKKKVQNIQKLPSIKMCSYPRNKFKNLLKPHHSINLSFGSGDHANLEKTSTSSHDILEKIQKKSEKVFTPEQIKECGIELPCKVPFNKNLKISTTQTERQHFALKSTLTEREKENQNNRKQFEEEYNNYLTTVKTKLNNLMFEFYLFVELFQTEIITNEKEIVENDKIGKILENMHQLPLKIDFVKSDNSSNERVIVARNNLFEKLEGILKSKTANFNSNFNSKTSLENGGHILNAADLFKKLNFCSTEAFEFTDFLLEYCRSMLQFSNKSTKIRNELEKEKIVKLIENMHEFYGENGLLKLNLETSRNLVADNNAEIEQLKNQVRELSEQNTKLKRNEESNRNFLTEKDNEIKNLNAKLQETAKECSDLKFECEIKSAVLTKCNDNIDRLNTEVQENREINSKLKEEIEEKSRLLEDIINQRGKINMEFDEKSDTKNKKKDELETEIKVPPFKFNLNEKYASQQLGNAYRILKKVNQRLRKQLNECNNRKISVKTVSGVVTKFYKLNKIQSKKKVKQKIEPVEEMVVADQWKNKGDNFEKSDPNLFDSGRNVTTGKQEECREKMEGNYGIVDAVEEQLNSENDCEIIYQTVSASHQSAAWVELLSSIRKEKSVFDIKDNIVDSNHNRISQASDSVTLFFESRRRRRQELSSNCCIDVSSSLTSWSTSTQRQSSAEKRLRLSAPLNNL